MVIGYIVLVAINTGLAYLKVENGIPIPITTEIMLKNETKKQIHKLYWGENNFVCERESLSGKWTIIFESPRLFNAENKIIFDNVSGENKYTYSINNGLTKH